MKSLNDLRMSSPDQLNESSLLEKAIALYFSKDFSYISLAKTIPNSELAEGLSIYDDSLLDFWSSIFSKSNIDLFVKKDYLKESVLDWIESESDFAVLKGKLNLKNQALKVEPSLGRILSLVNPRIFEEDISKLVKNLELLDESIDKDVDVVLVRKERYFELSLDNKPEETPSKLKKCIELLSVPLFLSVVLSSSNALATENASLNAIDSATKAALMQSGLDKKMEKFQRQLEDQGNQIIKEIGGEVPVAIVGVGVKVAVDRKIDFKTKTPIIPANLEVSVGLDETKMKISHDNMFDESIKGWISGSHTASMNKVEIGVKYDF